MLRVEPTVKTTINELHSKAGLLKIALNRCQPLPAPYVTLSENAGRINDEDDEVKLNTLTHFNKKTEHAFNGLHVYISVLTHFMYNT